MSAAPVRRSNLDVTGMRLVKKGLTVRVRGKHVPGLVLKVSRGQCLVRLVGWAAALPQYCEEVSVAAVPTGLLSSAVAGREGAPACGVASRPAAGLSALPDGNHGDNNKGGAQ